MVFCLILTAAASAQNSRSRNKEKDYTCFSIESLIYDRGFRIADDARIRVRQEEIRITHEDDFYSGRVLMTGNHELYIIGDKVKIGRADKKLVKEYYELSMDLMENAHEIGRAGMRMGLDGAKLAIKAGANIFRLLSAGYSIDDFERDIEFEAEKIELKAMRLEEDAEMIEDLKDELEGVHFKLRRQAKPLSDLKWF